MADGTAPVIHGVKLAVPIVEDYAYLAKRMRPDEIAQWLALTGLPDYNYNIAAQAFCCMQGPTFCLIGPDGLPIAAGGFEPIRPRVFQTWMVGTMEGWEKHWRAITKHSRRLIDDLLATQAQRVQTYAMASRKAAHVWYERGLGQSYEGTHRGFFSDGSDAVCYAKVAEVRRG